MMWFKGFLVLFFMFKVAAASSNEGFVFNGFSLETVSGENRTLDLVGVAEVDTDGICRLTNGNSFEIGQAFYADSFRFKNSTDSKVYSFSTAFVFAMVPENSQGHGMAFVLAPSKDFINISGQGASSAQYLGLFDPKGNGNSSNHIVAIELDTFQNQEFDDSNDNHIGIDINGLTSANSSSAKYVTKSGRLDHVDLANGDRRQLWVDYDGTKHQLNVTLSPFEKSKPINPLLSIDIDLSPFILDRMYVGFSSATGILVASSYILGWSFQIDETAADLDLSRLPTIPKKSRNPDVSLAVGFSLAGVLIVALILSAIFIWTSKKDTSIELLEDWEVQFGPHRFGYKDLFTATRGFNEKGLLGQGGFGQVYKGELPGSNIPIAVKRIFHKSQQGMKEFIAEICTIGRLRHPNLARLLGYCRSKDELFLVYDFMPNGSLDKFIHKKSEVTLNWHQRFSIIKDVASALVYLHEGWAEIVIHRDIKASNVLLDADFNGKLGDFGLARCSKQAQDPQTTHVAGTFGYMAPELAKTGKVSTSTDVYAFGAFCLEVACGRRPVRQNAPAEEVHLVDWVFKCWKEGDILKTSDSKLGNNFDVGEIDLVLKLGLLCSHNVAAFRPRMSQVILHLKGEASLPENLDAILQKSEFVEESDNHSKPWTNDSTAASLTITESFLSRGR